MALTVEQKVKKKLRMAAWYQSQKLKYEGTPEGETRAESKKKYKAEWYKRNMVVTKLSQRETDRVRGALRASQSRGKSSFYERRREIEG